MARPDLIAKRRVDRLSRHFLGCKCPNPWHCAPGTRQQNSMQDQIHRAATRAGHPLFKDPYE